MTDTMLLQEECIISADVDSDSAQVKFQHSAPIAGTLSRQQGLVLVERLIEDAAFRSRFEQNPVPALIELGISVEEIESLPARCQTGGMLASLDRLIETRKRLAEGAVNEYLSMISPKAQLI